MPRSKEETPDGRARRQWPGYHRDMGTTVIDENITLASETPEAFLEQLSPQHPLWQPDPTAWIFRGQADSRWKLIAKAHRGPDAYKGLGLDTVLAEPGLADRINQKNAEDDLLERFRAAIDFAGLPIPIENPTLSRSTTKIRGMYEVNRSAIPLLALAQHYGLPTSLLDWTRQATIAAYFAATDAAKHEDRTSSIVVWALRTAAIESGVYASSIRLETAPMASNPNLRAQAGLFTYLSDGDLVTVDKYLETANSRFPELKNRVPLPWMRKLTLPIVQAVSLLRLLSYSGIHGASMYPGYGGVVRQLREQALWAAD